MSLLWRRASFSPLLLIHTGFICPITTIPWGHLTKMAQTHQIRNQLLQFTFFFCLKGWDFLSRNQVARVRINWLSFLCETYYSRLLIIADQLKLVILLYFSLGRTHISVMSVTVLSYDILAHFERQVFKSLYPCIFAAKNSFGN